MKKSNWFKFKKFWAIVSMLLTLFVFTITQADPVPERPVPEGPTSERITTPIHLDSSPRLDAKVDASLVGESGRHVVIVRMTENSVGQRMSEVNNGRSSKIRANEIMARSADAQAAAGSALAQQEAVKAQIFAADPDARILGQTHILLNAIFVEINADAISKLAESIDIVAINQVKNYDLDLSETVPYIGGTAVQAEGYDGSGVTVAVLDSGIDYTHANLGGGGTLADYEAAWGTTITDTLNTTRDGLFPTDKVVEGYDFVGETWGRDASGTIIGALLPDEDPIDFGTHGTHVADIIAGKGGVAPGADLVAIKVCSAISPACSGVALIQGMEFAVAQGVDIINMSLGADYGSPFDSDLVAAVESASALGVLTVASAGNGGNNQYKVGTPSSAPSALSVAQTAVPSAKLDVMAVEGNGAYVAIFQAWSVPLADAITAPAQYGDLDGTNLNGCAPFTGDLTGLIVMVDRGACAFSVKISNIAAANGEVGVIGLIAPGDPFGGGFGGGDPTIPGFMVSQQAADAFRTAAAGGLSITFDPANALPLIGTMVGSSSRGPSQGNNLVKPEIGAPGASVSAIAGTGTGETAFGGTSGASPMAAGAAALLMDAYDVNQNRWIRPDQIKALLMNTAETEIYTTSTALSTQLAPITRIGGGEVRVDRALASSIVAYTDEFIGSGALSFRQVDTTRTKTYTQRFVVDNLTPETKTIKFTPTFRDPAKEATGAVEIKMRNSITIPGYQARIVTVRLIVDPTLLPDWTMNIGSGGAGAATLDINEFDGYILMSEMDGKEDKEDKDHRGSDKDDDKKDDCDKKKDECDDKDDKDDGKDKPEEDNPAIAHMAWHILPRAAGHITIDTTHVAALEEVQGLPAGRTELKNRGAVATSVSAFSHMGSSADLPPAVPGTNQPIADIKHAGYRAFLAPPEACAAGWGMEFAVASWDRQAHEWPNIYNVLLDTNANGTIDHVIYNYDLVLLTGALDGRNVTYVDTLDDETGDYLGTTAFFFTTNPTNYNNYILTVCGEQLGFEDTSPAGSPMGALVAGQDAYYTLALTDIEGPFTISPFGNRYMGLFETEAGTMSTNTVLDSKSSDDLIVVDFGEASPGTDEGVMLVYLTGAPEGHENGIITLWNPAEVGGPGGNSCQMLINGDAEGDLANSWTVWGNMRQASDSHSGDSSMVISGGWSGQTVAAAPGIDYTFSGAYKVTGGASWVGMGVDFLNADGLEIGEQLIQVDTNNKYETFGIPVTAPAGTAQIQVWFYGSHGGNLFVDDVVLSSGDCG